MIRLAEDIVTYWQKSEGQPSIDLTAIKNEKDLVREYIKTYGSDPEESGPPGASDRWFDTLQELKGAFKKYEKAVDEGYTHDKYGHELTEGFTDDRLKTENIGTFITPSGTETTSSASRYFTFINGRTFDFEELKDKIVRDPYETADPEMMPPEFVQEMNNFDMAYKAYLNAVNKGDKYGVDAIPLTGDPEETRSDDRNAVLAKDNINYTRDKPGVEYDPSHPTRLLIGKEYAQYDEMFPLLEGDEYLDVNPETVTKQEVYTHTWLNYWGNPESEQRVRTVVDQDKIDRNKDLNEKNRLQAEENQKLNEKNRKRNKAYADAVNIFSTSLYLSNEGDYADRRREIEALDVDDEAKKSISDLFKTFYRKERLVTWNSKDKGLQPPSGSFDPDYYATQVDGLAEEYAEKAKLFDEDGDLDITEGYGEKDYYHHHYSNIGMFSGKRGNKIEEKDAVDSLKGITDARDDEGTFIDDIKSRFRDDFLLRPATVDEDGIPIEYGTEVTQRILSVPAVQELYQAALKAKEEGDDSNYFVREGKERFRNIENPNEFVALFRVSQEPEHKDISFVNALNTDQSTTGISELEDLMIEEIGVEGLTETAKFARLNQHILQDTINEVKKARLKEQELDLLRGFGSFGEVFDINKTLADSLLNDTGVGGYLPFLGKDKGGFDEDKLEKKLEGVTGVKNNVLYNWENWFETNIEDKYTGEELRLGSTEDEEKDPVDIDKEFAERYMTDYLKPRFDTSRSMNEFIEYLDVRQQEKNPFTTQDVLTAVKHRAQVQNDSFLQQLKATSESAGERTFDADFYYDPIAAYDKRYAEDLKSDKQFAIKGYKEGSLTQKRLINQRDTIAKDWEQAKDDPDSLIEGLGYETTWKAQAYKYGVDLNKRDEFSKLHFQIKGVNMTDADGNPTPFDPTINYLSADRLRNFISEVQRPLMRDYLEEHPSVFGQFERPEEFAEELLEGLDPNLPETWEEALTDEDGNSLIEGFEGSFEDLKEYIAEVMRTGAAQDIRQQIKYLNEKREKPDQEKLGITYIEREEDYKPDPRLKGDTQLYKIFQNAGYDGSETDFYEKVFPDLNPEDQTLLTSAATRGGKFSIGGLSSEEFRTDPFAAFSVVSELTGGKDALFGESAEERKEREEKEKEDDADREYSPFRLFIDDDEEEDDDPFGFSNKSKSGQDLLRGYTKNLNASKFF